MIKRVLSNLWRKGVWILLLALVGCQSNSPIVFPTPAFLASAPTEVPSPTPSAIPTTAPTALPEDVLPAVTTTASPFPIVRAVRPVDIEVGETPETPIVDTVDVAEALETVEWRPPPMSAPLSIHPDDHYWLSRPLPSGSRNYALEWYPYGNDVLIPEFAPYRIHHGLDFPNADGTQVLAAGNGEIVWAGPRPSSRDGVNYYGNTIIIKHDWQWQGQDVYTLYAHTLEMFVRVGDFVQQGQLLAGVGGTGFTSGPHLHFEVRVGANRYFSTRNPYLWMVPFEGWGTLAGRFIDTRGEYISGAEILVVPLNVTFDTPIRRQLTYVDRRLVPDEVWQENFVVGDLPAGTYRVELSLTTAGDGLNRKFNNTIEIQPGRTNFMIVQADFAFEPTPTPLPTVITGTVPITGTVGLTETVPVSTEP